MRFVVWAPLFPSLFPTVPPGYESPTCSCPLPALAFSMGRTQAQATQAIGGKLGTGAKGGCKKVRTWSPKQHCQAVENRISLGAPFGTCDSAPCLSPGSQCHFYGDSAPPPCQWMPPLSCHDRQYLPQPTPFSPSWLLLPYVIILARESPLHASSHASITASPLPAPLASTASPL